MSTMNSEQEHNSARRLLLHGIFLSTSALMMQAAGGSKGSAQSITTNADHKGRQPSVYTRNNYRDGQLNKKYGWQGHASYDG